MTDTTPTVAVVGAGAVGATAAADLAARGVDVGLFDRDDPAAGSTPRAAGVCYDAFAEDVDAAVADRALERFREASGAGFAFEDCPYVWLAREGDDRRADAIREGVARMRGHDRDVERLAPPDLAERFPAVRADDVAVAAVANDAGYCDPRAYLDRTLDRFERAGGRLHAGTRVGVATDPADVTGADLDPDAVLVAAGAHSKRVLADAGVAVPVKPYRVQALTAALASAGDGRAGSPAYDGPMVYDATGGFYCRPHQTGLLAGDGTEEREADPEDYRRGATSGFAPDLSGRVADRLRVDPALERAWAGLCTATPDANPLLGAVAEGLYVATGFQGHGFMRAPALGERVAEAVLSGDPAPIDPFDPRRFDGDESFEVREGMLVD
jgi:glycine/D-amino acid oxidase-like deaminating enzyme